MNVPTYEMFPRACYEVDLEWRGIERHLAEEARHGLDLDPDFQRFHVWTEAQRTAYMEYMIRGGEVGRTLVVACTDWSATPTPNYVLVDGKQRLETVRRFLRGDVLAFGHPCTGFGPLRLFQSRFHWRVVERASREDILRLYLDMNEGGTPHSEEDLDRVRRLLAPYRRGYR